MDRSIPDRIVELIDRDPPINRDGSKKKKNPQKKKKNWKKNTILNFEKKIKKKYMFWGVEKINLKKNVVFLFKFWSFSRHFGQFGPKFNMSIQCRLIDPGSGVSPD